MELYENIIENKPVSETDDYNDFLNRRRNNKKSIRTKVTTLMENGEVHSEIMGTKTDEQITKLSTDGNKEDNVSKKEIVSNIENVTNGNNVNSSNTIESSKENNIKSDTKKDSDNSTKKNTEDKTVFGMKPSYGYTLIAVITLVGITAAVKIFKNNKPKLSLN